MQSTNNQLIIVYAHVRGLLNFVPYLSISSASRIPLASPHLPICTASPSVLEVRKFIYLFTFLVVNRSDLASVVLFD